MKLTLYKIRKAAILLAIILLSGGVGYRLGQSRITIEKEENFPQIKVERIIPQEKQGKVDFSLFWQVWDRLEEKHLERKNFDYSKMVLGAISGLTSSLDDPYTVFLPPTENKEAKEDLQGDFEGVGIQIGYDKDKRISVIAPLEGTPAMEAGLKSGDVILKIKDEQNKIDKETAGITLPEAVKLIRGKKGTKVTLTIYRQTTEKPFDVTLKRDTVVVKSVEVKFVEKNEKKVAVLKLSRFGERTYQEWEEAVIEIKNQKSFLDGIILDLRNNPGGFLQGAVFIGSEFLEEGTIAQQDSGINGKEILNVNRQGSLLSDPLIVLVNGGSASASEIVAGALQEYGRAKLVGEKTFGKGTVQEAEDLPGGSGLHITVARWLLPSGKSIDKEGVRPDIEVKIDPEQTDETKDVQLEKAVEVLTK